MAPSRDHSDHPSGEHSPENESAPSAGARARELAIRFHEGEASPEEIAELSSLLASSPEAAEQFARGARLEAMLEEHFQSVRADAAAQEMARLAAIIAPVRTATPLRRSAWAAATNLAGKAKRIVPAAGAALLAIAVIVGIASGVWYWNRQESGHAVVSGEIVVEGRAVASLRPGDRLSVVGNEPAVLELNDGSFVSLAPSSEGVIQSSREVRPAFQLVRGSGSFRVPRQGSEFRVSTELGEVTVLGTEFTVQMTRESTLGSESSRNPWCMTVAVTQGQVEVAAGGERRRLSTGEQHVFGAAGKKLKLREVRGKLIAAGGGNLTLAPLGDGEAREQVFELPADSLITIDGESRAASHLRPGLLVSVQTIERRAIAVHAHGPSLAGELKSIDAAAGTITLYGRKREGGREADRTWTLAPRVVIRISGKEGALADLEPGHVEIRLATDAIRVLSISQEWRKEKEGSREREKERPSTEREKKEKRERSETKPSDKESDSSE